MSDRIRILVYERNKLGGFSPQIHYDEVKLSKESRTEYFNPTGFVVPCVLRASDPEDFKQLVKLYPPPVVIGGEKDEASRPPDTPSASAESKE